VRGVYGYIATYAAGESAVLTLLAQDRVNVGRLHLEGRRTGARIGELVDAAAKENAVAPKKKAAPAKKLGAVAVPEGVPLPTLPPLPPRPARAPNSRANKES